MPFFVAFARTPKNSPCSSRSAKVEPPRRGEFFLCYRGRDEPVGTSRGDGRRRAASECVSPRKAKALWSSSVTALRVTFSMSGDGPGRVVAGILPAGSGFLDRTVEPESLPAWMNDADIREVAEEFSRRRFTGGLNWYRAIRKTSELMAAWRGCPIRQPSMFIAGDRDDVLKFPGMKARIDSLSSVLSGLRGVHILPGAGHWI